LIHLEQITNDNNNNKRRGVLWVHTKQVQQSAYFDNENANLSSFQMIGGKRYFCTGDVVDYDPVTDKMEVVDRSSNYVKLSLVSPEQIEGVLLLSPLVATVWVHAEVGGDCVVAVVCPRISKDGCIPTEEEVLRSIQTVARNRLQSHEIPRQILLELNPWSPYTGELTCSFKVARAALRNKYRDALAALFARNAWTQAFQVDAQHLDPSKTLLENGLSSRAILALSQRLEASNPHFGGPPIESLFSRTIDDLMSSSLHKNDESPSSTLSWWLKSPLNVHFDDTLISRFRSRTFKKDSPQKVLLTGATGFLGSFLLTQLLILGHNVVCIVRESKTATPMSRVESAAVYFGCRKRWPIDARLKCIAGDISKARLGLSESDYRRLLFDCDVIVHNAAQVNAVLPFSSLVAPNVLSTCHLLTLALESGCSRFCFVSSMSAVSMSNSGYAETKRASEDLVTRLQCAVPNLSTVIIRPGSIGMSSSTGALSANDVVIQVVQAVARLQCIPDTDGQAIRVIAVDDVASECCSHVLNDDQHGAIDLPGQSYVSMRDIGHALSINTVVSLSEFLSSIREVDDFVLLKRSGLPLVRVHGDVDVVGTDQLALCVAWMQSCKFICHRHPPCHCHRHPSIHFHHDIYM
jgi:thioester reductase-like protein